jgi:hypothetical protein
VIVTRAEKTDTELTIPILREVAGVIEATRVWPQNVHRNSSGADDYEVGRQDSPFRRK